MFDIGSAELILVLVITLLVVGPERLPGLVRTIGRFMGRARRMAQSIQYELERELDTNDIAGGHGAPDTDNATVTPHPKYGHLPERAASADDPADDHDHEVDDELDHDDRDHSDLHADFGSDGFDHPHHDHDPESLVEPPVAGETAGARTEVDDTSDHRVTPLHADRHRG